MSDNLNIWNKVKQPPVSLLKPIIGGRLKGMTDINPQWRYQAMTEVFGACGTGWKYEIVRVWTEPAPEGAVFAFAEVRLYTFKGDGWSDPIPATGGAMLIEKETKGLHANDEAFKMATTDALGTAMKMLGVAADIYLRNFDGTKYRNAVIPEKGETITEAQAETIRKLITDTNTPLATFLAAFKIANIGDLPVSRFAEAVQRFEERKKKELGK